MRALGDSEVARMLHFLRSNRPGAFADDAEEVARIIRRLNIARGVQAVDHVLTATDAAQGVLSDVFSSSPTASNWRVSVGGSP